MNHNKQQKLATDLGTTRALPEKASGEQTRKPTDSVLFGEAVERVNAFLEEVSDTLKRSLEVYGVEIRNAQFAWQPADFNAVEALARTRLSPEINIGVVKLADEFPSWLEGNLC